MQLSLPRPTAEKTRPRPQPRKVGKGVVPLAYRPRRRPGPRRGAAAPRSGAGRATSAAPPRSALHIRERPQQIHQASADKSLFVKVRHAKANEASRGHGSRFKRSEHATNRRRTKVFDKMQASDSGQKAAKKKERQSRSPKVYSDLYLRSAIPGSKVPSP